MALSVIQDTPMMCESLGAYSLFLFRAALTCFCMCWGSLRHGEASSVHRGGADHAGGEHPAAEEAAAGGGAARGFVQAAF